MSAPVITLIGGPTALIEENGFRLLTDPTFDAPGEYKLLHVTLKNFPGRRTKATSCCLAQAFLQSEVFWSLARSP